MPPRDRPSGPKRPPVGAEQTGPGPGSRHLPQAWLALALTCLSIYVGVMTLFKMSNNDIWIHLRTGEYVIKNGWVPHKDPYSFIAADHDYVAHEWLAGVLFYVVYSAGGVKGLIFFKSAILAATSALLYLTARRLGSRMSVILPAFTNLLYIGSARFLERPHIFSYLMAAVYLWLFFTYREGGRDRRWLYAILPAHVIWTNLHGGYVQGIVMVATFALGEALVCARARWLGIGADRAIPPRDLALLALLVPGCLIATFVNPYGYRLLTFPFELTGLEIFMQSIYEWQKPSHVSYNTSTMFIFYMVHVAALCGSFFIAYRDRTRARAGGEALGIVNVLFVAALALIFLTMIAFWFQNQGANWTPGKVETLLYTILGLFCLFTVVNLRSVDFTQAGIFALFFILSLRHNRAVTDAALGTFPILAASASAMLTSRRPALKETASTAAARKGSSRQQAAPPAIDTAAERRPPYPRDPSSVPAVVAGCVLTLGVSAHAMIFTYYFDFRGSGREKGFGIADNMPVCAVDFIAKNHITGNAYVSYPFAAMLIHRMHPEVKVNMDSRNDVYGEELYMEYVNALRSPELMKVYLSRHPIDFFLLSYADRVQSVFDPLEASGEWAPVYYDSRAFIVVKRKPETEDLIRREAFHYIRPAVINPTPVTTENAPMVLEEADRLIRNCPTAIFGWFYRTKALLMLQRFEDSLETSRKAAQLDSDNPQPYADMGAAYLGLGQRDRAVEMFEKAVSLDPTFTQARETLRRLRGF